MAAEIWDRVAIVGHSFVTRLEKFVGQGTNRAKRDFGLSTKNAVHWLGKGGEKVNGIIARWSDRLRKIEPQVIVLCFGDNDIRRGKDEEELACLVVAMASLFQNRFGARYVYIAQLMPRFFGTCNHHWFESTYNTKANRINELLQGKEAALPGIFFWTHKFVRFPSEDLIRAEKISRFMSSADGVHLNQKGLFKLYKSLASLLCMRRIAGTGRTSENVNDLQSAAGTARK